ncbi:MAG: hypothetical protein PVF27_08595, partial [Gemmatimonadales bacterium]
MTAAAEPQALYPTRSGAGAMLGNQIYKRVQQPMLLIGVTPTGVEIAASASKGIGCSFDVIVAAHVRIENLGIIGAVAEDSDAVLDPEFQPRFNVIDTLDEAIDRARRAVKTERLLFRGPRPLRTVQGMNVVVVEAHLVTPWKVLAAAEAIRAQEPARVLAAAAVSTQAVQERMRARKVDFICPSVIMDPGGHPRPFGDPQDPSAE